LTFRHKNRKRFGFPGPIPVYNCSQSPDILWNQEKIRERVSAVNKWSDQKKARN
jgi:hypothetical protein